MKKKFNTGTSSTPYGSVTHNADGTHDITLDPVKVNAVVIMQHEKVLNDVKAARAAGGMGLPDAMLAELEAHAQVMLDKVRASLLPTTTPTTLRMK